MFSYSVFWLFLCNSCLHVTIFLTFDGIAQTKLSKSPSLHLNIMLNDTEHSMGCDNLISSYIVINTSNTNTPDNVNSVVIKGVHVVYLMNVEEQQALANLQSKQTDLSCETPVDCCH